MIKCIATDMDGTLLHPDQTISKENKAAFIAAQEAGIEVVVTTGRSYEGALSPIKEAGMECNFICMNGALISSFNGEEILSIPMSKEITTLAGKVLHEEQMYYEIYTNKGQFALNNKDSHELIAKIIFKGGHFSNYRDVLEYVKKRFHDGNIRMIENEHVLLDDPKMEIYKIIAFSLNDDTLKNAKYKLTQLTDLEISSSGFSNIEITNKQAQKGLTLERYVNLKGWSIDEAMAIGDSYNDVSMLKSAGYSVAMGNAPDEIKAICDHVTKTNIENGFAAAVYKTIELNNKNLIK